MKEYKIKETNYYLRYHDFPGEETPIIFIHGLGCAGSFDYPEVAAQSELSGHRRILVDLLGAGFSDKPLDFDYTIESHICYLRTFIADLRLDEVIIFGHSFGGSVAIELAELIEEKLSAIILSEANLDSGGGFTSKQIASMTLLEFETTGYREMIAANRQSGNGLWASCFAQWLPKAAYQASTALVAGQTPSWREMLTALLCPKTFIFGEENLADPDVKELAKAAIEIAVVEGAGHSMAWENPQGLAKAILSGIRNV